MCGLETLITVCKVYLHVCCTVTVLTNVTNMDVTWMLHVCTMYNGCYSLAK